ncbi:MAG: hypothetical protein HYZ29_01055 [Myxococcales bacterium]|nr:hypothetical protein [Myxococcales bacterium]
MIIDADMVLLTNLTASLDEQIERLLPPADECDADHLEFLVGLGFVACQWYLTERRSWAHVEQGSALKAGPQHRHGVGIASVVNAAANFWKHAAEWRDDGLADRQANTLKPLLDLGLQEPIDLWSVLDELVRPHPPRFRSLLPFLEQWGQNVVPPAKE